MEALPTLAGLMDMIAFHLEWVEIDQEITPLLSDLAEPQQWFEYERRDMIGGLFLHTINIGARTLRRGLALRGFTPDESISVVSHGLTPLSLTAPYDSLPLQAGTITQLAFDAQMRQAIPVTMGDVTIFAEEISPCHLLSATEAAFGFVGTLLRTCLTHPGR